MVLADRRARLDGIGADAAVVELELDDVLGLGERGVGRLLVAHHEPDRDVIGRLVPHRRSAGFHRILERDHRRQHLVVDLDQLGGVRAPASAFPRRRRRRVRRPTRTLPTERMERSVRYPFGPPMSSGMTGEKLPSLSASTSAPVSTATTPSARLGLGGVDALDPRVRVRRHDHHAVTLLRQVDIVDIAAAAGDEAGILKTGHRLANTEFCHVFPPRPARAIGPITSVAPQRDHRYQDRSYTRRTPGMRMPEADLG